MDGMAFGEKPLVAFAEELERATRFRLLQAPREQDMLRKPKTRLESSRTPHVTPRSSGRTDEYHRVLAP